MSDKIFVDSNILIYAHDSDAKSKRVVAKGVLAELWSERIAYSRKILTQDK
jgi:predicted nucleic acid-binding protein